VNPLEDRLYISDYKVRDSYHRQGLDMECCRRPHPAHGIKRPRVETNAGKTPALGNHQAKALPDAPQADSLKELRDQAIPAVLLHHGLRREECAQLQLHDLQERRGIKHLRILGKRGKLRFLPQYPITTERIHAHLEQSGHHLIDPHGSLFVPLQGHSTGTGITANGIYTLVGVYAKRASIEVASLGVHDLRATAATNALKNEADIAKAQAWLSHPNISTTRIYDRANSCDLKILSPSRCATRSKKLRPSTFRQAPLPTPYTLQHGEHTEHAKHIQHTEHRKQKIKS
jgi:site-specific recombinase XerD